MSALDDEDPEVICSKCVGDPYLRTWVEEAGGVGTCRFCAGHQRGVTLEDLAAKIDTALRENYFSAPDTPHVVDWSDNTQWWQEGREFDEVLQEIAGIEPEISEAVFEYLAENEDCDISDGEEPFYGDTLLQHAEVHSSRFMDLWLEFENRLKHEVRFFDDHCRDLLDRIFGDLRTFAGGQAIVTLQAGSDVKIYRSRLIENESAAERFIRHPEIELGPPPPQHARAGRLNPSGIPAFYGAFSEEVALAEIRPLVGSRVAVGTFTLLREVQLLDFTFLPFAYHSESIFSPKYQEAREKVVFLEGFQGRISRPVLPSDEPLAYLPTQAVAAYFTNIIGLDGFIYASTQTWAEGHAVGRVERENCNVAFFGSAAKVGSVVGSQTSTQDAGDATLRAEPNPTLHRVRFVKVGTTHIFGHIYEDGSVIISEDDDDQE